MFYFKIMFKSTGIIISGDLKKEMPSEILKRNLNKIIKDNSLVQKLVEYTYEKLL